MNPLRCFPSPINAHPTDAPLIDSTPAPRPASQVCMGLVWQALARVKSATLQVVRHLDCRQGLPADSLEPPSSYAPVSSTPVDADAPVPVAVQVAVHEVVEMVADAGAAPVKPAESSEPAAEELPHDAPPSPAPAREAPSLLKSVLRRRSTPDHVDTSPICVSRNPGIRELFAARNWPGSWGLLDFSLLTPAIDDPSVQAFHCAVAGPASSLKAQAQEWKKPTLTVGQRRTMLDGIRRELRTLIAHTQAFMETVSSGQIDEIGGNDAEWQLEKLENKLINLRASEARINGHIEEQEAMLRAGIEVIPIDLPQPLPPVPVFGTDASPRPQASDENSSDFRGLDFDGIGAFDEGDTAEVVNRLHEPLCELLMTIDELADEAEHKNQTAIGRADVSQRMIECFRDLDALLGSHLKSYDGSNSRFREWMGNRLHEVQLGLNGLEKALDRLSARPGAGPQPG